MPEASIVRFDFADVTQSTRSALARVVSAHHGPPCASARLPMISAPLSEAAASFRLLRYRLQRLQQSRVVAVTSPVRGEGKTTCAANLALALAEQGEADVLLVEANLEYPRLGEELGLRAPFCFAEQMRAANLRSVRQWHAVSAFFPNLHVLAVDPDTTESQLLNPTAFHATLEQLRCSSYSSIILDCPAALGSADMNIIADCVDGILLTARARQTQSAELLRCVRNLEPATVLGTVLLGD